MATNFHRVKKDLNHRPLVQLLRAHGATVIDCAALKNAFDLLVIYKGNTYIMEVKSGKGKLSDGELECKAQVEKHGVKYHVIREFDQALELLGII